MRRTCVGLTLALTLPFLPAQTSISLDPPRVEKLVGPGKRFNDSVAFTNRGRVPVSVSVSVVDFDLSREGELLEMPAGTAPSSISPWLRITPLQTQVAPGQRIFFRYSLLGPKDLDHRRGIVYFSADPIVEEGTAARVLLATTMGIPFYVENPRSPAGRLEIEDLEWRRDQEQDDLILSVRLRNTGSRNLRPQGFVAIESFQGNYARLFDFNERSDVILPGTVRRLERRFGPVPQGELKIRTRISVSPRKSESFRHELAAAGIQSAAGARSAGEGND